MNAAPRATIEKSLPPMQAPGGGFMPFVFASEEEYERFVREKSIPADAKNVTRIEETPARCELRNAWRIAGGKIDFDMPRARNIWRDKMREKRRPILEELDRQHTRASAQRGDADAIEAKRQALRDVTAIPEIEAAMTPDELKAVWPECLGPKTG